MEKFTIKILIEFEKQKNHIKNTNKGKYTFKKFKGTIFEYTKGKIN